MYNSPAETPYLRLVGDSNITATLGSRPEVEFVLAVDSDGVRDFQKNISNFLSFSFTNHDMMKTALSLPQVDPNNFQHYKTVLPSVKLTTEGIYTLNYTGMNMQFVCHVTTYVAVCILLCGVVAR